MGLDVGEGHILVMLLVGESGTVTTTPLTVVVVIIMITTTGIKHLLYASPCAEYFAHTAHLILSITPQGKCL